MPKCWGGQVPYRCGIRNGLCCAKKHSKRDSVSQFAFKLLIREIVKLLNEQGLKHNNHIEVRSAAAICIVLEHGFKFRPKVLPIYSIPNLDEFVSKLFDTFWTAPLIVDK